MDDEILEKARSGWHNRGDKRPDFALTPTAEQESVWDYPRPPALVVDNRHVQVKIGDALIADTHEAVRVLETASPPTFYIPPQAVNMDLLSASSEHSFCEWKGHAAYYHCQIAGQLYENVAWYYPETYDEMNKIKNYLAFYPSRVECYVDGERVRSQLGGFYGGWVTDEIIGPYKGEPGSSAW